MFLSCCASIVISQAIGNLPSVKTRTVTPPVANHVPHLIVDWNRERIHISPDQVKHQLARGQNPILTARVHGTGTDGFLISVFMLQPGQDIIVGDRLAEILKSAIA